MLKKMLAISAVALFTFASTVFAASAAGFTTTPGIPSNQAPAIVAPASVTPEEAEALQYMREEEKLAHDVYVTLYETWDLRVFNNIARAEQKHTDSVGYWLDYYRISDPTDGNGFGEFDNAELQTLYDDLVAQGKQSVVDALKVGAAVEEIDILDLQERLDETGNSAIQRLFENLLAGSENHLRAFASNIQAQTDDDYAPQYLSQAAYDEIVSAAGRGAGNGGWAGWAGGRGGGSRP